MNLSSASACALRALAFLARHEGGGAVPSRAIAAAEGLPERFLPKVLESLATAGVLLSVRGIHGGYRLARPARRITLLEVVEAVDGPVRGEVPRFGADAKLDARLQEACDAVTEVVRARLRKVSVADLAGEG
jgi:Rrf2 family protein